MKGFNYFEGWLIEGRNGVLQELKEEFQAYDDQLEGERGRRSQLETELRKLKAEVNDYRQVARRYADLGQGQGHRDRDVGVGGTTQTKNAREVGVEGEGCGPSSSSTATNLSNLSTSKRNMEPEVEIVDSRPRTPSAAVGTPGEQVKKRRRERSPRGSNRTTLEQEAIIHGVGEASKPTSGHPSGTSTPGSASKKNSPPKAIATNRKKPKSREAKRLGNRPGLPFPLYEPYSNKLEQLWTLIIDSSLPKCGKATRRLAIKLVAQVPIPFGNQRELVHFICKSAATQGMDGNYSQSLHCYRLLGSLLNNPTMDYDDNIDYMRQTIDELFPAIVKRLQRTPTSKKDWELLELTSSLLGKVAKMWGSVRVALTHLFSFRLSQIVEFSYDRGLPLMTLYSVIFSVKEMGEKAVRTLVLSNMRHIGERLRSAKKSRNKSEFPEFDKVAIQRVQSLILETVSPILESTRALPDPLLGYEAEFGNYFGEKLFHFVRYLRDQKQGR